MFTDKRIAGGWLLEIQDSDTRSHSSSSDSGLWLALAKKSTLVKVRERSCFRVMFQMLSVNILLICSVSTFLSLVMFGNYVLASYKLLGDGADLCNAKSQLLH